MSKTGYGIWKNILWEKSLMMGRSTSSEEGILVVAVVNEVNPEAEQGGPFFAIHGRVVSN